MIEIPRESVEILATTVTVNGEPVDNYQVAVTTHSARPTAWVAPTSVDGIVGPLVGPLAAGLYRVWARYVDNPESPVVQLGDFRVT